MKKKFILAFLVAAGLIATAAQTKMFVYHSDGTKYVVDVDKVDSVCFANVADSIPEENLEGCQTVKVADSELKFTFSEETKTAEVSGFDKSKTGEDLVIPCFVEKDGVEYKVTSIAEAALQQAPVVNMVIGNTVASIGDYAFSYMDNLEKVVFPKNLEVLSKSLFLQTNKLYDVTLPEKLKKIEHGALQVINIHGKAKKLELPSTLEKIEDQAFGSTGYEEIVIPKGCVIEGEPFYGCSSLLKIVVDAEDPNYSNYDDCLYNKDQTVLICCPGGKSSVKFPSTVKEVAQYGFAGNTKSLKSIELPNTITKLGDYVFGICYALESVVLPESITEIPTRAFQSCYRLKDITLPAKLKTIGELAFYSNDSLTSITIPNTVESIGAEAFSSCEKLDSVIIPNSVKTLGKEVFAECPSLHYVSLPENLETIPNRAFFSCKNLETVVMPKKVKVISGWAFQTCQRLKKIDIPNTVTTIGESAFGSCADTVIVIPNSVTSIGKSAFNGCDNVTRIEIPSSITSLPYRVFGGCRALESVVIPSSVTSIDGTAFAGCKMLKSIEIEDGNPKYKSVEGIVYNSDMTTIVICPSGIDSIEIPETVTSIGNSLFSGFNLKSITISGSVKTIGNEAFYSATIDSLVIPATVESVGDGAFVSSKIKTLIFEGDTKLGKDVFVRSGIVNLTLPGSVTEVSETLLQDCYSLESVVFPASVTSIPANTFRFSYSLKKIIVSNECEVSSNAFMMPERVEIVRY